MARKGYKQTEEHTKKSRKAPLKHGHTKNGKMTKIYRSWENMRMRCNNPKTIYYKNYGGRGIKICERWNSFENFLADMGESPVGFMLDRIDNNGNYEPSNCRWVDKKTSDRNRRTTKMSMEKANEIRRLFSEGYSQQKIARQFNIDDTIICRIINGKIWN